MLALACSPVVAAKDEACKVLEAGAICRASCARHAGLCHKVSIVPPDLVFLRLPQHCVLGRLQIWRCLQAQTLIGCSGASADLPAIRSAVATHQSFGMYVSLQDCKYQATTV